MPKMNLIIDDFSVGEVSPLTESMIASDEFQNGLVEVTNMVPDAHGPLMGRPGMEYIDSIALLTGESATIFEVNHSDSKYFAVVLTHELISVYQGWDGVLMYTEVTPFTAYELHGPLQQQHRFKGVVSPNNNELIITSHEHPPYILTIDVWGLTATFAQITFTAPPAEWTGTGFPSYCMFFQGRSWWTNAWGYPNRIWSSKSGAYYNMATGSAADDAIVFDLAHKGPIMWLESATNLLIGTQDGEWVAQSEGPILQPGDFAVYRQSTNGSCSVKPVMAGTEVVFVASHQRAVKSMWYRWIEYGWLNRDITFTAEHICWPKVEHVDYSRNPYPMLWMTMQDGTVVGCSFLRQSEMAPAVGWFRMENAAFEIKCATVVEADGIGELWTAIRDYNEPDGSVTIRICKKQTRDYQDDFEVFLDNFVTVQHVSPTDTTDFSGISDFIGDTVDVVADGFHYPAQVLVNGVLTLPRNHIRVTAGHPYTQRIRTMPVIMKSENAVGHQFKRWNKVFLRTIKSYRPLVNGLRPPERHVQTNDDIAEPFVDGFIQITPATGWDRTGSLTIEQDLPFRLLLTGIYGEFNSEQIF